MEVLPFFYQDYILKPPNKKNVFVERKKKKL